MADSKDHTTTAIVIAGLFALALVAMVIIATKQREASPTAATITPTQAGGFRIVQS